MLNTSYSGTSSDQRPPIISRIYTWIYGTNDFKENNYVPSKENIDPDLNVGMKTTNHAPHISDQNPDLSNIAALGNYLSDRINWLFEMVGKLSLAQSEIGNETNLKLDLAENVLTRIDEHIPISFREAFTHFYEVSFEIRNMHDKLLQDIEQLNQEIHSISLRLRAIEKATGADLYGSS